VTGDQRKEQKRDAMIRVAMVQDILRRWDPIGVAPGEFGPADEYDSYAPSIVSMVVQGCTTEELSKHLEIIRVETIGIEAKPDRDREIAGEILKAIRENERSGR
jgi:hypothetical protein